MADISRRGGREGGKKGGEVLSPRLNPATVACFAVEGKGERGKRREKKFLFPLFRLKFSPLQLSSSLVKATYVTKEGEGERKREGEKGMDFVVGLAEIGGASRLFGLQIGLLSRSCQEREEEKKKKKKSIFPPSLHRTRTYPGLDPPWFWLAVTRKREGGGRGERGKKGEKGHIRFFISSRPIPRERSWRRGKKGKKREGGGERSAYCFLTICSSSAFSQYCLFELGPAAVL